VARTLMFLVRSFLVLITTWQRTTFFWKRVAIIGAPGHHNAICLDHSKGYCVKIYLYTRHILQESITRLSLGWDMYSMSRQSFLDTIAQPSRRRHS
jgi:hypothetical protein